MTTPSMGRDEYLKAKYVWSGGDLIVADRPPTPTQDSPQPDRKNRKS